MRHLFIWVKSKNEYKHIFIFRIRGGEIATIQNSTYTSWLKHVIHLKLDCESQRCLKQRGNRAYLSGLVWSWVRPEVWSGGSVASDRKSPKNVLVFVIFCCCCFVILFCYFVLLFCLLLFFYSVCLGPALTAGQCLAGVVPFFHTRRAQMYHPKHGFAQPGQHFCVYATSIIVLKQ